MFVSAMTSPVGALLSNHRQQPTKPSLRGLQNSEPPSYLGLPPSSNCNTPPVWADDEVGWDDLTADQRNAAIFLGYTESIWNGRMNSGGSDSDNESQEQALFDAYYADLEWTDLTSAQQLAFSYLGENAGSYSDFYDDYDFDELPLTVQAAANAVGYTQDVWGNCIAGEICNAQVDNLRWRGLSKVQRTNLKLLGYDCWTWNNYDPNAQVWQETEPPSYLGLPPSSNCNTPPAWADESLDWAGLTADQLSAAVFLGYTESTWNNIPSYYDEKEWDDLIPAQQIAFRYLGYNSGSFSDFYNDYWFAELPPKVQVAANAVGYTQDIWDNCAAEICSAQVDGSEWKFLSLEQRANLKVLGYECWTWNR